MSILNDIQELLKAEIISQETAEKINEYYAIKEDSSHSKLFIVFGILGAILIGLGIILIIGHNWDQLTRITKTIIAFLPLLIGHTVGYYVLLKKADSTAWKEGIGAFLFFAVGASMAMISQIYNLSGSLSSFLLTWLLLSLPMVYLLKSSISSLLYIAGITYYASQVGYFSHHSLISNYYWYLLGLIIPYYYLLYKKSPRSNFMSFHNWLIPLSIVVSLGTFITKNDIFIPVAYISLFGLLYLMGNLRYLKSQKLRNNGYLIIGSLGSVITLLILSFDSYWNSLRNKNLIVDEILLSKEFVLVNILTLSALILLYFQWKGKTIKEINPIGGLFIAFILIFLIGMYSQLAVILVNILLFAIGILTIRNGVKSNHLGVLNYGLLVVTALVISRFFDSDLSFVFRGILFIGVGVGFFVVNYQMLKKRKQNEH
jgi:uncharacterized membrane protein